MMTTTETQSWIEGAVPNIPNGAKRHFWVTLRDKQTASLSVRPMTYMHAHIMALNDACDEPPDCAKPHKPEEDGYCEEYEWTGWTRGFCESCECEWMWNDDEQEIIAFATAPEPYQRSNNPII